MTEMAQMIDYWDVLARLLTALLFGGIIGLDRNLHGKQTGMKTLGLVALGAALVTMASMAFVTAPGSYSAEALSRVMQGVITGIGFLGAGVIVLDRNSAKVHGLTTAASIWVTACIGIVCGMGDWRVAAMALALVLLLFVLGHPLERHLHNRWMRKSDKERDELTRHED
jgi:putative Mg2+ transporter-C (MgtC) family protein